MNGLKFKDHFIPPIFLFIIILIFIVTIIPSATAQLIEKEILGQTPDINPIKYITTIPWSDLIPDISISGEPGIEYSEETCIFVSDYYSVPQNNLSRVDLGPIYLTHAGLPSQGASLLNVLDCYGNDNLLDVSIPWSEQNANPPAMIHLSDDICENYLPTKVIVNLYHYNYCTLYAIDDNNTIVDFDIAIIGPGSGIQSLVLESANGIRRVEIDGSEICITSICFSCEGGTTVIDPDCICNQDDSGSLDILDTYGQAGDIISVPIQIQYAPNTVESFGFDVIYNPDALLYLDYEEGPLSSSFDFFAAFVQETGRLRIGGVDSVIDNESILTNSQGILLNLKFEVLSETEDCNYPLLIVNPEDDIETWLISGGCFTVSPISICTGDLNGDDNITSKDALIAFKCYMGSGECIPCCDINGDGQYTPADALCIFNKYMGFDSCLD